MAKNVRASGLELKLTDLIDRPTLQALQDRFSEKYNVPTAILDLEAEPITFERRHNAYCREIRQLHAGYRHCRKCDRRIIEHVRHTGRHYWRLCDHGGLLDFATPLRVSKRIVACFFIGQVRGVQGTQETNGIAASLDCLHRLARRTNEASSISEESLKTKYARIPRRSAEDIDGIQQAAIAFANDLGRILTKLEQWYKPHAVAEFLRDLFRTRDLDGLFDICVREIPRLLGTKHCSILTVMHGTRGGAARLVLRRTSYEPSKGQEGMISYRLGKGLTGWVWKNKRPLRLDDIRDPAEIRKYHGLKWSHTVNDSDHHREWLGVPLLRRQGEVIGVIRVPEKKTRGTGGRGFSFRDEILLMSIAQHVSHQIEDIRARERVRTTIQVVRDCAIELARAATPEDVCDTVLRASIRGLGEAGTVHFFNMLDADSQQLTVQDVRGALASRAIRGMEVPLDSSLSGEGLRRGRAVIVREMKKAEQRKCYFPAVEEVKCGMSAPILFGSKRLGALSVGADRRYQFLEDDLHFVRDLADLAGAALARLTAEVEAQRASEELSGHIGHILKAHIGQLTDKPGVAQATVDFLKSAANRALAFGQNLRWANFQEFDLNAVIQSLKSTCPDPRVRWEVRKPFTMVGDSRLIEEILLELTTNALRFIPKREGRVRVKAWYSHKKHRTIKLGKRHVVIEVHDNGPGFPKGHPVFEFQPNRALDKDHFGFGLGIVRRAVAVHRGIIEQLGQPRSGAVFRIRLPQ